VWNSVVAFKFLSGVTNVNRRGIGRLPSRGSAESLTGRPLSSSPSFRIHGSTASSGVLEMPTTALGSRCLLVPYKARGGPYGDFWYWEDLDNVLLQDRIIFVGKYLDEDECNNLIASLLYLRSDDAKKPISIYFNAPGALLKSCMAVYDTMMSIECPIYTLNLALAPGMATLLCAAGTKGKRFSLPNARFLVCKTGNEDGLQGQAEDISVEVAEALRDNERFVMALALHTGQSVDKIEQDLKRDFYLNAAEARLYGIVDSVLLPESDRRLGVTAGFGQMEGDGQKYQDQIPTASTFEGPPFFPRSGEKGQGEAWGGLG